MNYQGNILMLSKKVNFKIGKILLLIHSGNLTCDKLDGWFN
jgi:hypothetical protein